MNEKPFAEALDELINEYLEDGAADEEDIASDLEIKLMAMNEELRA